MTLRSCPERRPTAVRRSAPQPRLLAGVQRKRPPLSRCSPRWARQAVCTNHGGGTRGGRLGSATAHLVLAHAAPYGPEVSGPSTLVTARRARQPSGQSPRSAGPVTAPAEE